MFPALAIQVTNYIQSVNKRVVARMTWEPSIASLFRKKISLRLENVVWEGRDVVERLAHQFCTAFSVIRP